MIQRLQAMQQRRSQAGFTLIELLVVIVILAILAAVVVFAVQGVGDKGKSSAISIDSRTIATAEEAYCAQNGRYGNGNELVSGGFLSELPRYHQVFARQGDGPCNRWQYSILRASEAGPYPQGSWALTTPTPNNMFPMFISRLADGRVLVGGVEQGSGDDPDDVTDDLPITAIWDPVSAGWTMADPHPIDLWARIIQASMLLTDDPSTPINECASSTVDNCGKVLMRERYLFDSTAPSGSQWTELETPPGCYLCGFTFGYETFNMTQLRGSATTCGSVCGNILITGHNTGSNPESALLYNPRDNSYQVLPYNYDARRLAFHSFATPLSDGRVLFCCEDDNPTANGTPTSDFFNPLTLQWSPGPQPPSLYRRYPGRSYNLTTPSPEPTPVLPNGDILHHRDAYNLGTGATIGIYTPQSGASGSWRTVPQCSANAFGCAPIRSLPDGRVLARDNNSTTTYFYNPATERWDPAGEMNGLMRGHGDTPGWAPIYLDPAGGPCGSNCGKVFVAGFQSAELFTFTA